MTNAVNVFLNDPNAQGLGIETVTPPVGKSPFAIPGWTGAGGLFNPGSPEFEAGQLYVTLTQTYGAWAEFFGADFGWQPGLAALPIFPRAGVALNAYYDRRGLKFFFNTDAASGTPIYTSESGDIIAHECGHAVLDAQHPDYWDSLLGETGAFHEAFGDVSAILVALANPRVRAAVLAEHAGDLRQSNAVTRLAEQLARAFVNAGRANLVDAPNALRDAVNAFKYRDPDNLPTRAPATQLSSESHNFSRIFSGAFYDLLVGVYEALRGANANLAADDALAQARGIGGRLIAQGLILAPRGDAPFKAIAVAMLTADQQNFGGAYFAALKKAFVARRILKASEANALRKNAGAGHTQTSVGAGVASVPLDVRPSWELSETRVGEDLPSGIRRALAAPRQAYQLVGAQTGDDASRMLYYTAPRQVELKGADLGVARGAVVTLMDAVAVRVDRDGRLVSSHHHKVDRGQTRRVRDHVAKLIERDRVFAGKEGEAVDSGDLIERGQPYYVAVDAAGNKRIHRAFIACGECARRGVAR